MKSKKINLFSIFVLIVFALAIVFFISSVLVENSIGKNKSQELYSNFSNLTVNYLNQIGLNEDFSLKYGEKIKGIADVAAVMILKDGDVFYAYPVTSPLFYINEFSEPEMKGSSPCVKMFSSNLDCDYPGVVLSVAVYTITPERIFFFAKITFFVILCATMLVFIVLIVVYVKMKNTDSEMEVKIDETTDISEEKKDSHPELFAEKQVDSEMKEEVESENDTTKEQNSITDENREDDDQIEELEKTEEVLTKNGISQKSFLESRLDNELSNTVSSEQDLAFFLIKTEGLSIDSNKSEQIIEVLIKDIKYRDLIFEYDDETYAVILPSFNLDKSMMFIQQLYANIENAIEDNGINARLAIGISTRSLRIIPAERIITEASQALDKALSQEGSIPVVAFRVDLEKYKKSLMED